MESEERGNLGTIYFPISFGALVYYYWSQPVLMVAAMMPMTWGDAMAALTGQRYGHYRYSITGRTRSIEGSAAMLFWSWITTTLALLIMPYLVGKPPINWLLTLVYGGAVAIVCTLVEALTPWGLDNLTVPAAAAVVLHLLRN
jgi:phytol kinase